MFISVEAMFEIIYILLAVSALEINGISPDIPEPRNKNEPTENSCDELYQDIFERSYKLAGSVETKNKHTFVASRKQRYTLESKIFLLRLNSSQGIPYHGAIVFIPVGLNFKIALDGNSTKLQFTAGFQNAEDGELVFCSTPVKGIILLSDPLVPQTEIDFYIRNIPPKKRVEVYVLFVVKTNPTRVVRDVVSFTSPTPKSVSYGRGVVGKHSSGNDANDDVQTLPGTPHKTESELRQGRKQFNADQIGEDEADEPNGENPAGVERRMRGLMTRSGSGKTKKKAKKDKEKKAKTSSEIPESYPSDHVLPDYLVNERDIYSGCASSYSCFMFPPECHYSRNCFMLFNFKRSAVPDHITMVISASTINWAAVGFSQDNLMGDDAVIVCRRLPHSHQTSLWAAFNPEPPEVYTIGTVIQTSVPSYIDVSEGYGSCYKGVLTCKFDLQVQFKTENNLEIDFLRSKFYLLLAIGMNNDEPQGFGSIGRHELVIASTEPVNLTQNSAQIVRYIFLKVSVHEQLVVFVFSLLLPVAVLMAHFGQHGFQSKVIADWPTWLLVHVVCVLLAAIFQISNLFVIYIGRSGSIFHINFSSTYHGIIGPILFFTFLGNFGLGIYVYIRYRRKNEPTPAPLKWCHWCLGNLILLFGAIELIRGPRISKSYVSCSFSVVAGFSYLIFVGASLLLMFNTEHLRLKQELDEPFFRSFFGPAIPLKDSKDGKGRAFSERRYILGFTFLALVICTLALLVELLVSKQHCTPNSMDYI